MRQAVDAVRCGDNVVLSPAFDGGYTLIGLSKPHARLFAEIPWSTSEVYELTLDRAREIGVPVVNVPGWYDVDDAASLRMLEAELSGERPPFAAMDLIGAEAPATRRFMRARQTAPADLTAMRFSAGERIVSVVIPCLNEEAPIAGVVCEVLAQNVDEVIVVDNGSTDEPPSGPPRRARGSCASPSAVMVAPAPPD